MAIKINDIPPEGLTVEMAESCNLFGEGGAPTAYSANLTMHPLAGGMFHVTGRVKAEPLLECSRCLKTFPFSIDAELDFELAPATAIGAEHERELERTELDQEFYEGEELEPAELIREQLLLGIPMVPLHSADCKGLCPVCGTDLNAADCGCPRDQRKESGPFSILKDIFKK